MKCIAMIGTRFDTMGGISAVVDVYRRAGLFDRWPIVYIASHRDGGRLAKAAILLKALARYAGLLASRKIGLLHIHLAGDASFWRKCLFAFPAYAKGVPVLIHLHGGEFDKFYERECGPRRKRVVRALFDRASCIITLSESWKTWLAGLSRNPNVVPIYNPVLVPPAVAWGERRQGDVLFLGRLGERKGSYDLVEAFAAVHAACDDARLLLGGDGEVEETRRRAASLGLGDAVTLLGWVRGGDRDRRLAEAGVYALPAYREGLPMGLLEAMAAGLPVLTCPIGGIPEAVDDGVEGFLVTPGDVPAIADRLTRLLSDPALAKRMGGAARARVERSFSADIIVPQVEALYRKLLPA